MADETKSSSRNSCALPTGIRVRNMTAARNVLTWRRATATNAALFIRPLLVPDCTGDIGSFKSGHLTKKVCLRSCEDCTRHRGDLKSSDDVKPVETELSRGSR